MNIDDVNVGDKVSFRGGQAIVKAFKIFESGAERVVIQTEHGTLRDVRASELENDA